MHAKTLRTRLQSPEARRFVTFLLTGGVAAVVNVASRILFDVVTPYAVSVVLAYLVAMTTAFSLAKIFVFSGTGRRLHVEFGRFALVNVAALIQVLAVSLVLADFAFPAIGFVWHAETIAHVIGVLSPVLVSYHGHKRFSFA